MSNLDIVTAVIMLIYCAVIGWFVNKLDQLINGVLYENLQR